MSFFTAEELRCKCGRAACDAPLLVAPDLLARLDNLRFRLGRPILVASGLRCAYWNEKKGGKPTSEHLTGDGVDVACPNSMERYALIAANFEGKAPLFTRFGIGRDFVHFGVAASLAPRVTWTYYTA